MFDIENKKYICATNKIIYRNNLLGIQDFFLTKEKGRNEVFDFRSENG